jgi:hypothetical protein
VYVPGYGAAVARKSPTMCGRCTRWLVSCSSSEFRLMRPVCQSSPVSGERLSSVIHLRFCQVNVLIALL